MKIEIDKIDRTQFMVHEHTLNGEIVHLIQPQHIGTKWRQDNKHMRSVVVNYEGEVISASLPKFTNWGENPDNFPVPNSLKHCTVVEKLDGCCDENTVLITEDGEKTIKEICELEYKGKVLGYNHLTEENVFANIISHSIKDNNNDWYELETESGIKIKLTGNHKVWLPEIDCYREVRNLNGDENILLKN